MRPLLPYRYFAHHYKNRLRFTPLTPSEYLRCRDQKICESSQPTYEDTHELCAISNFYEVQTECTYITIESLDPEFVTVQDRTYYAQPPNRTNEVKILCNEDLNRGMYRQKITLKYEYGSFDIQERCYATFGDRQMKPALRAFNDDRIRNFTKIEETENGR